MTDEEFEKIRNLDEGKTFTFGDKILKVAKNSNIGCFGCFFHKNKDYCCYGVVLPYCDGFIKHGSKIIFKEVENDK